MFIHSSHQSCCVSVLQVQMETCTNAPPPMSSMMMTATQNLCLRRKSPVQTSPGFKHHMLQSHRANHRRRLLSPRRLPNKTTDCSCGSLPVSLVRGRGHTSLCHQRPSVRSNTQTGRQRSGRYGSSCHQTV